MSAAVFQSLLVRLVTDPDFRLSVRTQGTPPDSELTPLERRRLAAVADDAGVDTNRMLHLGFRLGKLKALLPMTSAWLTGPALHDRAQQFWSTHPPRTFYFLPEAVEFCQFLLACSHPGSHLHQIAAFECAHLNLQRSDIGQPRQQRVRFQRDPALLLGPLLRGARPRQVPRRRCEVIGSLDGQGKVRWTIEDLSRPQPGGGPRRPGGVPY